ncbi:hypothetical protein AMTRI_Chr11g150420 [Amborella trichopoda]
MDALNATSARFPTSSSSSHVSLDALQGPNHFNCLPEKDPLFSNAALPSHVRWGHQNSLFSDETHMSSQNLSRKEPSSPNCALCSHVSNPDHAPTATSFDKPQFPLSDPNAKTAPSKNRIISMDAPAAMSEGFYTCSPSSSSSSSTTWPSSSHVPKRKAGRKKFKETRHPVFRGVRQRKGGKWVCEIREPHKKTRIWLGTYTCPEMAARAHDVAVIALRGKDAALNFADSAWRLPVARTSSREDIREAAKTAVKHLTAPIPASSPVNDSWDPACQCREVTSSREALYLDEEALFDMPGLITDLAEGLLITPPSFKGGFSWDDLDTHVDFELWKW